MSVTTDDPLFSERVVETFVAYRKSHGITQQQMAEMMGVTQATVSQFESHANSPRMSTLSRYALALGLEVHWDVQPIEKPEDEA